MAGSTGSRGIALRLDAVGKSYGSRCVLQGISLAAGEGDVLSVVGPNGSGKSTLLKIVAGLVRPSRGEVTAHRDGRVLDASARRRAVGYAAPDLTLYAELSGRENLRFFTSVRGTAMTAGEADRRLARVGLEGRGNDRVETYSSGMRQRLRLAFALLDSPRLLLLDEPSLALDEQGVALVAEIVADQETTGGITLLATNDRREAALGKRRLVLGG